ncbi:SpoIIE family protein phosphatase [Caloranaerobacter azorensis]|uniref:SpoIIE family protein phosphatase n=1 Tax=Caloranaerobacter azorensis TaxID=116090 RepID=A0A6P1YFE2_9FIRM|nr:SpoIIE family protein phosphatase [Caloranaerobacter azorensis]QIB28020.1 SpoIIE family protein phosphatase [Caloranaerobacter azorensis]
MLKEGLRQDEKTEIYQRLPYDILDGMIDWVRVIDKNGTIIYANKTMRKELGEDIVGNKCYLALKKPCHCETCITQSTIKTGEILEKEEIIDDRIFAVKTSPVRDNKGNIYAAVEVFRDVTKERKLEYELIEKNEKMRSELAFARKLQEKILPKKGMYGNLLIDYVYNPSEMLSGDMFDIFNIDDNNIGVYISDVVGHGVSASMITMFVKQSMRDIKDHILSPRETLIKLHKGFLELGLDDDKYFTIFYGVINTKENTFTFVNGGHNCSPILIRDNRVKLLEAKGYPITYLFDKVDYDEHKIKLIEDDKLIFYTDGIIEAINEKGEQFGIDRLLNMMKYKGDQFMGYIEDEIDDFRQSVKQDDFAVLMMRVLK